MSGPRRLEVDWTRCDGHGLCAGMWPERIGVDDWGFPLFSPEVTDDEVRDARRAVAICPQLALRLEKG